MTPRSAGILVFRRRAALEVLLAHMGGPLWARRHQGAWTIPKGEIGPGEEPWAAAAREFVEELGLPLPAGTPLPLGTIRQSRKVVHAWALEADLDPATITPGTFWMQWPPRSGTLQQFAEVDRVAWLRLEEAREVIVAGQRVLLQRLADLLDQPHHN